MALIKLTNATSGRTMQVRVKSIKGTPQTAEKGTRINFTGGRIRYAKESPEEIQAMIEERESVNSEQ